MALRVKCYDILHDTGASMRAFVLYTVKEPKKEGRVIKSLLSCFGARLWVTAVLKSVGERRLLCSGGICSSEVTQT